MDSQLVTCEPSPVVTVPSKLKGWLAAALVFVGSAWLMYVMHGMTVQAVYGTGSHCGIYRVRSEMLMTGPIPLALGVLLIFSFISLKHQHGHRVARTMMVMVFVHYLVCCALSGIVGG